MCLDMRVLDENMEEVALRDSSEEEDANMVMSIRDDAAYMDLAMDDDEADETEGDDGEDEAELELDEELEIDGDGEDAELLEEEDSDEFEDELVEEEDFIDDLDLL